jgi:hypothetical protein
MITSLLFPPFPTPPHPPYRLKDVLFLDLALAATSRAALEGRLHLVSAADNLPLPVALRLLALAAEGVALGAGGVTAGAPGALRGEAVLCADQLGRLLGAVDGEWGCWIRIWVDAMSSS